MQDALAAVRGGMSKRSAANLYNVPRTTINNKIAGKLQKQER